MRLTGQMLVWTRAKWNPSCCNDRGRLMNDMKGLIFNKITLGGYTPSLEIEEVLAQEHKNRDIYL